MRGADSQGFFRRSIWDYHRLRRIYGSLVRNRRFQLRRSRIASKRYLNTGCGGNPHDDFINLDYRWHPRVDLCWDITRGIPLQRDSLDGIFSEHCLEHIPLADTYRVLVEFRRMLRPGGAVRIAVPNGDLYLDLYQRSRSDPGVVFPGGPTAGTELETGVTPMVIVNRAFRAFGHLFVYDFKTLSLLVRRAGFVDVRAETFRHGRDPRLLIDYHKRADNSLYVEASVPKGEGETDAPAFDVADLVAYLEGEKPPPGQLNPLGPT